MPDPGRDALSRVRRHMSGRFALASLGKRSCAIGVEALAHSATPDRAGARPLEFGHFERVTPPRDRSGFMVGSRFRVTGVAIPKSRLDHPLPIGLLESGVQLLFTANPGRYCTKDVRLALPRLVFKPGFLAVGFWDIARRSRRSVPLPCWEPSP